MNPPSSSASWSVAPLDYNAMRMLRFKAVLVDFFRRWGLYLVIAVALFSAGSNAPLTIAAATASSLLWPLVAAAARGWPIVPATIGYALLGALPVVTTRALWWPRHWRLAEQALPLADDVVRRSDRLFCMIVMTPWQLVLVVGGIGIASHGEPTRDATIALVAWTISAFVSMRLSLAWMQGVRRRAGPSIASRSRATLRHAARADLLVTRELAGWRALVVLPLLRGRATRSAAASIGGWVAALLCAAALAWRHVELGWSLSLLAVVSLVATSLLRSTTTRELMPLWRTSRQLPLDARRCERAKTLVVLMPVLVGLVAGLCVIVFAARPVAPRALAGFGFALALGCGIEATLSEAMDSTNHAARWILIMVIAIAFASEVAP